MNTISIKNVVIKTAEMKYYYRLYYQMLLAKKEQVAADDYLTKKLSFAEFRNIHKVNLGKITLYPHSIEINDNN